MNHFLDIVKLLSLEEVIYGEQGIINKRNKEEYKKARKELSWLTQKPMGLEEDIKEEIKVKKVKAYKVRDVYADGMIVEQKLDSDNRRLGISIEQGPVIDLKHKGFYTVYNHILAGLRDIEDIAKRKLIANKIMEVVLYFEVPAREERYTYAVKEDLAKRVASAA